MKIRTIHGPVIGIAKEVYKPGKIQCEPTEEGDFVCDVPDDVGVMLLAAAFNNDYVKFEEEQPTPAASPETPKTPESGKTRK